jgi:hypothetical protein
LGSDHPDPLPDWRLQPLKKPRLDFTPFRDKYRRMPNKDLIALWTFSLEEERFSFQGTLAQAISTASLLAHANAIEDPVVHLTDYRPVPRRILVREFDT